MKKIPTLYIVVPCYNEQEALERYSEVFLNKLIELEKNKIVSNSSRILFVNDGSSDNTEEILKALTKKDNRFAMLSFLKNAGHQNAIYAGMVTAKDYCDIAITIDADLQQDINAMEKFIEKYHEGNDVVFGVRNDRHSDDFIKKTTASLYYAFMKFLGSNILANSADYRLMSKKALQILSEYKESNLFLRGLIPSLGLQSDIVYFDVEERQVGKSKYTFKKMFNLAIDGIISFSTTPIHLICLLGIVLMGISFVLFIVYLFSGFNYEKVLIMLLVLFAGMIILSIGFVGEYIGNTYLQVKQRPRYLIDYVIINKNERNEIKKNQR